MGHMNSHAGHMQVISITTDAPVDREGLTLILYSDLSPRNLHITFLNIFMHAANSV